MNNRSSAFVADGLRRLLQSPEFRAKQAAIEAHVRAHYSDALAAASDYWQRVVIEEDIEREIDRRLKSVMPSPYSLWTSR